MIFTVGISDNKDTNDSSIVEHLQSAPNFGIKLASQNIIKVGKYRDTVSNLKIVSATKSAPTQQKENVNTILWKS